MPDRWAAFLTGVGQRLPIPIEVHCIGAFALMARYAAVLDPRELQYLTALPPGGVDILRTLAGEDSDLTKLHHLSFRFVGGTDFVEDYEKRLQPIAPGRFGKLRLFALEPHDLILCGIGSDPAKRSSVIYLAGRRLIKSRVLRKRYQTCLRPYVANPRRLDRVLHTWLDELF